MKKTKVLISLMLVLIMLFSLGSFSVIRAAAFSGAIFTTDTSGSTNVNLYHDKTMVYLNGGPTHPGAAGLPDGSYYVQVTDPGGAVLGSSLFAPEGLKTPVVVDNGEFAHLYSLWDIVYYSNGDQGYADTPNAGGVYKVWVSSSSSFSNDESKTDNFRVKNGGSDPMTASISGFKYEDLDFDGVKDPDEPLLPGWEINLYLNGILIDTTTTDLYGNFLFGSLEAGAYKVTETPQSGWKQTEAANGYSFDLATGEAKTGKAFGNTRNGKLIVKKFYDADADGYWDSDKEPLLTGWKVNVSGIGDVYTRWDAYVKAGTYVITEYMPVQPCWIATTDTTKTISLGLTKEEIVFFGNVCLGEGGGRTLGFWSNKNGEKIFMKYDSLSFMKALNLRNADGSDFEPASYEAFKKWLLDANAKNMAYMLSAQLAAMKLNVHNGLVDNQSLVWVGPNKWTANAITIDTLRELANASLGNDGLTQNGHPMREYQEFLKNALDKANNNLNFIQSSPCDFSF